VSSIRTILFDLDGTLIDTNELIMISFKHTFEKYGLSFPEEETKKFNGPPLIDTFQSIHPEKAEEMVIAYQEYNHAVHDEYVKSFPNAAETLEQLKQRHINLGIVSTKMRKGVDMGLSITGLDRFFDTIITLDDVRHPKPHPEPVIKAMEDLQADVSSTLMVGDNYHDIEAGKNAGVQTAGVAWSHKGKDFLLTYEPTYMIDDMEDLLKLAGVKHAKNGAI